MNQNALNEYAWAANKIKLQTAMTNVDDSHKEDGQESTELEYKTEYARLGGLILADDGSLRDPEQVKNEMEEVVARMEAPVAVPGDVPTPAIEEASAEEPAPKVELGAAPKKRATKKK